MSFRRMRGLGRAGAFLCTTVALRCLYPEICEAASETAADRKDARIAEARNGDQLVRERLKTIEAGNPADAARALTALVPDGETWLRLHEKLAKLIQSARGDTELEALWESCPPYHRWHAYEEITEPARYVAILQWVAQKVWEMPKGPKKEEAAQKLVADVAQAIDNGRMGTAIGLRLAYHSLMYPERIRPGVSAAPLVALIEKRCKGSDDRWTLGTLLEILDLVYPDDAAAQEAKRFLHRTYGGAAATGTGPRWVALEIPISWEEYEELSSLPLPQLRDRLKAHDLGSRNAYMREATRRLVEAYDARPDEVGALVSSLLQDNVLSQNILAACTTPGGELQADRRGPTPGSVDAQYFERKAGLIKILLDHIEKHAPEANRHLLTDTTRCLNDYLQAIGQLEMSQRTPWVRELEVRLVRLLLQEGVVWEKANDAGEPEGYHHNSPLILLAKRQSTLSPEAKQYLKESTQKLLSDTQWQADLPSAARMDTERALQRIVALPLQ